MSDRITFDDCCRMILEQGPQGPRRVPADQPDYARDLLLLLNKEFGIEWNAGGETESPHVVWDGDGNPWNGGLPYIATSLVERYRGIVGPFSGWLEYTFVKGEAQVLDAHRPVIDEAATVLRQRFVAFFRDLLLLRWPNAARRTTSWTKLQALGLVLPVHDPDDF